VFGIYSQTPIMLIFGLWFMFWGAVLFADPRGFGKRAWMSAGLKSSRYATHAKRKKFGGFFLSLGALIVVLAFIR
jgi:hypothetical protein